MTNKRTRAGIMPRALLAFAGSLFALSRAFAVDADNSGDIVVTDVRGVVTVTSTDRVVLVHVGSVIVPPATIRTGADGAIDLRQGQTTVAIAANTAVDLPATPTPGAALDRIVQLRGSALYKVGKREAHKLRVETPHLVAVIKGTQFNVLAQSDRTTIALFEGKLDVRVPDDSDITDLNAGEIAVRRLAEPTIRVLRMDTGQMLRGQADQPTVGAPQVAAARGGIDASTNTVDASATAATTNIPSRTEPVAVARSVEVRVDDRAAGSSVAVSGGASVSAPTKVEETSSVAATAPVAVSVNTNTTVTASVAPTNVSTPTNVSATTNTTVAVETPPASVSADLGAAASVGNTTPANVASNATVTISNPTKNITVVAGAGATITPTDLNSGTSVTVNAGNANIIAGSNAAGSNGNGLNVNLGNGNGNGDADVDTDTGKGTGKSTHTPKVPGH